MNQRKRLARLEALAAPVIERVKRENEVQRRMIRDYAALHACYFAAIVCYGDPKIDEPLSEAWPRCIQSPIWQDFPNTEIIPLLNPFDEFEARILADVLNKHWVPTLPGANQKEKFNPIFANAPPWLIWFTFADWTASFLGLELPDLSQISNFDRPFLVLQKIWPRLPKGRFEFAQRRNDFDSLREISTKDIVFFKEHFDVPDEQMTRLQRKKFNSIAEKLWVGRLSPLVRHKFEMLIYEQHRESAGARKSRVNNADQ